MNKDKSEKSTSSAESYPEGNWPIFIRDNSVFIGRLNLMKVSVQNIGAMLFDDNPWFNYIANKSFPVQVNDYDPITGYIDFQILGAAEYYNSETSPDYRFMFVGYYKSDELSGDAKVPKDFGRVPGTVGEDGDNVTWKSGGPTDPYKPSK